MKKPFKIYKAKGSTVPIVLSVPHCGTQFPKELKKKYNPRLQKIVDDTDFYVDQLYNFVSEMGITMIRARYSRWVIDLNRDPESAPLYNDGRIITGSHLQQTFLDMNFIEKKNMCPIKRRLIDV